MAARIDLPQGTLDLLILRALVNEPLHGWAVSERLQQVSRAVVQVPQGSLYPALHRLERRGWIAPTWGVSARGRKAKFYELTARGRTHLDRERRAWRRFAQAVALVLDRA